MTKAFDQIAEVYDDGFSNTAVGSMQRKVVWNYIDKTLGHEKKLDILELNCGTGDDAIWLAAHGHRVLATDGSEKMLEVAELKTKTESVKSKPMFSFLDMANPESYPTDKKFDLVFSNFGGFNCISPDHFLHVIPVIAKLLNPKGRFIAVIMPKFCLWESAYFILKGKSSEVFRRNTSKPVKANIGDKFIDTWYYAPSDVARISVNEFKTINKLPVGIALPPSYLNNYFSKHPNSLQFFQNMENTFGFLSILAGVSDHFIIDMEAKS